MPVTITHKVVSAIRQFGLCQCNDCIIAGISGGADSVALLDLLANLPGFPLRLVIAHLNHQLRGEESDGDEQFVNKLAESYDLPCEVRRVDVRQLAGQQRMPLEEAGRKARYDFFEELRQKYHATAVAVGHHADDQAETFLLRLLRGAGITGLAAMSPINQSRVIRPLLAISRRELRQHLDLKQLRFREDSSNTDHSYLRNRIRHDLLPRLQEYTPDISQRLATTACLLREDEALLSYYTAVAFSEGSRCGTGWTALSLDYLRQQQRPLRLRLYRTAIETVLGNLRRFELKHHQMLEQLFLNGATGRSLNLPRNLAALITADHLLFADRERLKPPSPCCCSIPGLGRFVLGNGLTLAVEQVPPPLSWGELPGWITYVDPVRAPFPWQVRPVIAGERLQLLGMQGSRSVQDILTDLKFPRHLRNSLPLVSCGDIALWLAGVRRTRYALVSPDQRDAIRISLYGREQLPLFP